MSMLPAIRKREPAVPQRVKDAITFLFDMPGADLQAAAKHVGLPTYKLRYAMNQPHCLRYLLQEKQARLEAASAGNIGALLSVRDHGDNQMARVHASKTLEQMLDATSERTGIGRAAQERRQPGLQIVIVERDGREQVVPMPPAAPQIEGTAVPEADVVQVPTDAEAD
jgi:hypothetical protein